MTKLLMRKLLVVIPILLVACGKTPAPSSTARSQTAATTASPSVTKKVDANTTGAKQRQRGHP